MRPPLLMLLLACAIASACAAHTGLSPDPTVGESARSRSAASSDSTAVRSAASERSANEGPAASEGRPVDELTRRELEARGAAAVAAYRATQEAFNRGDTGAYARGYAPVMSCWYGRAEQRFRRRPEANARVQVHRVDVLSATAGEILLADLGAFAPSSYYRFTAHRKLIQMRLSGAATAY